jgi:hypothetical protein
MSVPSSWAIIKSDVSELNVGSIVLGDIKADVSELNVGSIVLGKFPKEHRLHSKHGESLKTTTKQRCFID